MVLSFVVLGTALVVFSLRYSNSEKIRMNLEGADNISKLAIVYGSNANTNLFIYSLQLSAYNLDAKIYICNTTGKIEVAATSTSTITKSESKIPPSVMHEINSREKISGNGTLGGFFDRSCIYAGVPIDFTGDGSVDGAVFVCSDSGSQIHLVTEIFKIFIFCVCLILLLSFIAIYFVTERLVRPLRQMSSAAKSFAKGDFSARIPIRDNDEIGQLSVAFNNMAASLTSLEEMRRSFVANVSHELKTPMTSIAGFIDGILDGTIPKEKERYYLKIVSDEVKRLSRLVRSFLDIARIEAGEFKINPAEFDVTETIRRVVIGFEQAIDQKALDIRGMDFDDKVMVSADPDLTHQIIYNLVDNAVKFSDQGGYIQINVAAKGKKVYVGVKNSGMGIPAKDLPYVFDRFYKTDKSRSKDRKGVGLGLYIVKAVLNMQEQDITVKSVEGEYCEFVFTLKQI